MESILSHNLVSKQSIKVFLEKFICKLGVAVISRKDKHCCVRQDLKMPILHLKSIFLSQHSKVAYYCNNSLSHFQL